MEQAVIAAACEYDINPAEVAYKQVEKRHGFLRTPKRVVIEVDPRAPRLERAQLDEGGSEAATPASPPTGSRSRPPVPEKESGPKEDAPESCSPEGVGVETSRSAAPPMERPDPPEGDSGGEREGEERGQEEAENPETAGGPGRKEVQPERKDNPDGGGQDELVAEPAGAEELDEEGYDDEDMTPAEEAVDVLIAVSGLDLEWEIEESPDRVEVVFEGTDSELLLREHGKSLFAIEHLLPKVIRGISGEKVFCHVDCQEFRENRRRELETLALSAAEEVKGSGEPKALPLLNPSERRIIHMTLADDADVETESEGGGYLKRLTVWPS